MAPSLIRESPITAVPLSDPAQITSVFTRRRRVTLATVTFGYAFFYTCRLPLSVVKKPLIDAGLLTASDFGTIGAAFFYAYAAGKLLNGWLADHASLRKVMSLGLFASALVNLAMGTTTLVWLCAALWALNGLFQGTGAPVSVVAITRWYGPRERGTTYGLWSVAHAIGEGMTFVGTAALVAATSWHFAYIGPAITCMVVAVLIGSFLIDRPEHLGLPDVRDWRPDLCFDESAPHEDVSTRDPSVALRLLTRPSLWILGLASATMYVTRYAINSWGVLFLQEAHGYSLVEAGGIIGVSTFSGIAGSALYGWLSDRYFQARRPPPTLIFGVVEVISLAMFFAVPPGSTWMLIAAIFVYGLTIGGLIAVLGGLFAVDIAPGGSAGLAVGMIGMFSYIGAALQE
ncbi:MAG: MFS transporter, partial [Myxococcales bacterium]|nr:MFS transporter [Myxococcales bacterium]